MNILIISLFFPPHLGGIETATYYLARNLAELGHKVVVLTSKCKKNKNKLYQKNTFLIYRFKAFNPPKLKSFPQISSFGLMPKAIFKLPKIIQKHNIQIIHVEGRFFPISFITTALNRLIFKKPMVLTIQARLNMGITGVFEMFFDKLITKHLYEKLEKIICVSTSIKEHLKKFKIKNNKLVVIPNGVDPDFFSRNELSKFLDPYISDKKDYKKIAFAGRLCLQKGVFYLLRAIPYVLREYRKVHFFILGNGNLEKKIKKLANKLKIQPNITFIDTIPLEKMPEFYSSADIFCLPSLHEGFPLTIVEALSIGLIIVASATDGISEAIVENINGFLAEPKNFTQLAKKLIKALNLNNKQIVQIYENNVNLAREKYSWKQITEKIVNVYKDCLR